jgi:hypothetical protein
MTVRNVKGELSSNMGEVGGELISTPLVTLLQSNHCHQSSNVVFSVTLTELPPLYMNLPLGLRLHQGELGLCGLVGLQDLLDLGGLERAT